MSIEQALAARPPILLGPDEGRHLDFLNHRATIKVAAGDDGTMSVVEFLAPRGFGPPQHRHEEEDELFILFEGTMRFLTGDLEWEATSGAYALLPRAIPHTFQVLSESARFVNVTASNSGAPRFDSMVAALGTPTDRLTLPEPSYIDPAEVAAVCHEHGIEIVGPPPAALN
mgnify:CR=1 FL=1